MFTKRFTEHRMYSHRKNGSNYEVVSLNDSVIASFTGGSGKLDLEAESRAERFVEIENQIANILAINDLVAGEADPLQSVLDINGGGNNVTVSKVLGVNTGFPNQNKYIR